MQELDGLRLQSSGYCLSLWVLAGVAGSWHALPEEGLRCLMLAIEVSYGLL